MMTMPTKNVSAYCRTLLAQARQLLVRVGQFRECIAKFDARDIELEPLRVPRVIRLAARQRCHAAIRGGIFVHTALPKLNSCIL